MTTREFHNPERVECVRWSPGSCGLLAAGAALLLALSSAPASAQELNVTPSIEVQYSAAAGQVFELQGSNDLRSWRDVKDVVFGEGERIGARFDSAVTAPGTYQFYRVKISPSKSFGFAPTHLPGKHLLLNDEGESQLVYFNSRAAATSGDATFAYSYRKTGGMTGRLSIGLTAGETETIELEFSADRVGHYTRTRTANGQVDDIDRGTFALGRGSHASPGSPATVLPDSLVGQSYLFSDGDTHERMDFVTELGGRTIDRDYVEHFNYEFSTAGEVVTATVSLPGEVSVEFEMTFGGRHSGIFVRREVVDGVPESTTEGVFSCAASVYHSEGAESTTVTLPAGDLAGRTYVMQDGGTPCHLRFENQQSGECTEGTRVDPFQFDYVVNCNSTSTVTLHFGVGEYDEYRLNHSDQVFVRSEVRGGELRDTDSGTFSESP